MRKEPSLGAYGLHCICREVSRPRPLLPSSQTHFDRGRPGSTRGRSIPTW
jgi:hypothetical protein